MVSVSVCVAAPPKVIVGAMASVMTLPLRPASADAVRVPPH
jgi:hypothetical protein